MTSLGWFDRFFRSVEGWRERVKQIHQRNDDGQPADYCYHTGTSNGVERHHRHTFSSSFLKLSMEIINGSCKETLVIEFDSETD